MTDNPPTTNQHTTPTGAVYTTPPPTGEHRIHTGPGGSLDIDNLFTYHPPHGDQVDRYQQLREAGRQLALQLAELVPGSVERSTALSRLRECIMWANAAIACNERPPSEHRVGCVYTDCDWWVETGLGPHSGAPMLHTHLLADHGIETAVHISIDGDVHLDPDPRDAAIDGLAPAQINTVPYQPDTPHAASSVQPMDDPYAGVSLDVPTPSTQRAVCMITHEPPWCDGPCKHANPVEAPADDIPTTPVLDVNAPDQLAEARRYAAAVEQWHAVLPVTQSPPSEPS